MKFNMLWAPIALILVAGACFTSYTKQYTRAEAAAETEAASEPEVYTRLIALDEQIAGNREKEAGFSANARKAAAETERRLWQAELDRILSILKEQLPEDEWNQLATEQNQWFVKREDHAEAASKQRSSSASEELDHQISLTASTRERVYQLADTYQEALSDAEEESGSAAGTASGYETAGN